METPVAGLKPWDFLAVGVYLLLTFGISVWSSSRQKSTDDFFVGGRRMPSMAVGLSILATLFSTISYLAVPGESVKNGIAVSLGYLAVPLNVAVISLLWIPFFMRLRLTSAYEYLELRFGRPARKLGASLFILLRIGWMSMVVYVVSLVVSHIVGPSLQFLPGRDVFWIIGLIAVTAAIYTAIGGIEAVIWVDVLQCLLLLSGVLMAIGYVYVVDQTGPLDWWNTVNQTLPQHTAPPLFSWDLGVRLTITIAIINNFFWNICTHGSDQVVLQRYFSTSSLKAARSSYFVNVIVDFGMSILLAMAGFALLTHYLKHPQLLPTGETAPHMADKLFPFFLGNQLPAGFAGLILSAFLCDAIQTLESGANSISAVVTRDLLMEPNENSTAHLWRVRIFSAGLAILVGLNGCGIWYLQEVQHTTIIDMMPKFFNLFVGPLAAMFFTGMFVPRVTGRSMIPAVLIGLLTSITWSWWETIFRTQWRPTIMLSIPVPCVTTFVSAWLISLFIDPPRRQTDVAFSWLSVIRQAPPELDKQLKSDDLISQADPDRR